MCLCYLKTKITIHKNNVYFLKAYYNNILESYYLL